MLPTTQEWVDKAEGDWAVAGREYRARKSPSYDAVCFHAQQCAEKYLKGRMIEAGILFPKTHDLESLLNVVLPTEPFWSIFRPALVLLSNYAVAYRYPGDTADKTEARNALKLCASIRAAARLSLGLPLD